MAKRTADRPVTSKQYYTAYKSMVKERLAKAIADKEVRYPEMIKLRNIIKDNKESYEKDFNLNINLYKEFYTNEYNNGSLLDKAKSIFAKENLTKEQNDLIFSLIKYAKLQKEIHELDNIIKLSEKANKVTLREYEQLLYVYAVAIHKKLILEQAGYSMSNSLGTIAINRYKNTSRRRDKLVDFNATNKRKKELEEQGIEVYNKEKAEWCEKHGIPYNAQKVVIYRKAPEYNNELVSMHQRFEGANKYNFVPIKYRCAELHNITNQDIKSRNADNLEKLCEERVDVLVKTDLILELKPHLKDKFVRYENQESFANREINSKNRQ